MWRADGRPMRLGRSALAALVCTLLAAGSHLTAGGRASSMILSAVFLGTWLAAAALTARRLTTAQLGGLLLLGQAVVHLVSTPSGAAGSDAAMLAAHVVGTALSLVVLRRGEDALWTLTDRVALRAGAVTALGPVAPWRPAAAPAAPVRSHRPVLLAHSIEGRGPPVGLA